jgi:hypothetical protein
VKGSKVKNNDKISRTFSILLVALLILILLSCEQSETLSPIESENIEGTSNSSITFPFAKPAPPTDPSTELYPQIGWHVYKYWKAQDSYRGGTLNMPNGTFFQLIAGSLIPPCPNELKKMSQRMNSYLLLDRQDAPLILQQKYISVMIS